MHGHVEDVRECSKSATSSPLVRPESFPLDNYLPSDVVLRQAKIKSEVKRGNVEHILPLVASKARETWKHYPKHVQAWISLDDLIAEGVDHAVTVVLKMHSPRKSAGYVTYLYKSLENLYKDKLKALYADKRFVRCILSVDSTNVLTSDGNILNLFEYYKENRPDRYTADEIKIISRIDAERAFIRAYAKSSHRLKKYLIMWILQPTEPKFKLYGSKFLEAKHELKSLAPEALLGTETCRFIWRDAECRRSICRTLCKKFRTPLRESKPGHDQPTLPSSLESMVAGVALTESSLKNSVPPRIVIECPKIVISPPKKKQRRDGATKLTSRS